MLGKRLSPENGSSSVLVGECAAASREDAPFLPAHRLHLSLLVRSFVSTARGEQEYFDPNGVATATEGAKSNALMRCCKDLGIASELWDPRFIRTFRAKHCVEVWVEDAKTGRKRKLWRRKDQPAFEYPYKETGVAK